METLCLLVNDTMYVYVYVIFSVQWCNGEVLLNQQSFNYLKKHTMQKLFPFIEVPKTFRAYVITYPKMTFQLCYWEFWKTPYFHHLDVDVDRCGQPGLWSFLVAGEICRTIGRQLANTCFAFEPDSKIGFSSLSKMIEKTNVSISEDVFCLLLAALRDLFTQTLVYLLTKFRLFNQIARHTVSSVKLYVI